ncbi:MAG: tetratricopeptide repeat protein [Acidimicrobiia bacterium]|nr:tetratricopeptide repeat protein [Acidimicrobiia bacterium]MBT8249999.1 tetratricopeptide repeat protein [Acidimicrobiia bacterium]NNC41745.1 tetratricopeptide repeat protein [Acidimicrobiia bacterium]NNL28168.1 tetratricopeptide repeat protein [Acidimicrobiia bacterium]
MIGRERLSEQLAQATRDLDDVTDQLAKGELADEDAAKLIVQYEAEKQRLEKALATIDESANETPGFSPRVWWLTATTIVALVAIGFLVTQSITDRPEGGFVTGNLETGRDLDTVSNEEMEATIAQFPDIIGMRAALARRYFESGDFPAATGHYLEILDRDPNHPEALANLGWITFTSNGGPEADTAAENLLKRSLDALPGNPDALFFLANIRLSEGDGLAAGELLNQLLATGAVGEQDRPLIDELLAEAERLTGSDE